MGWFLKAAALIRQRVPDVRFAMAAFKPRQADMARREVEASGLPVEIHVSDEKLKVAAEWAICQMRQADGEQSRAHVDLRGKLESAGFEYKAAGGMVEVTPESVAAVLGAMLSPRLREMIDQALAPKQG